MVNENQQERVIDAIHEILESFSTELRDLKDYLGVVPEPCEPPDQK